MESISDLIIFLPLAVVVVAAIVVPQVVLPRLGLPFMSWRDWTPEKVAKWRRLGRWQVGFVRYLFVFPGPMLLWFASEKYVEILDVRDMRRLIPSYVPRHHPYADLLMLLGIIVLLLGGAITTRDFWRRLWEAKFDLPSGKLSYNPGRISAGLSEES